MTDTTAMSDVTLREKLAHIDQMLADIDRTFADRDRKRQEIRFAPWQLVLSGTAVGVALFASGAAFIKLLVG